MSELGGEIVAWKMQGGVVNLPQEFREVAEAANCFGLQGLELADVEVGVDLEAARRGVLDPGACVMMKFRAGPIDWRTRFMNNDDHQKTMDDLFATWSKLPAEFRRRFVDKAEGHEIGAAANPRPAEKPRAKRTRKVLGKNLEQTAGEQL